MTKFKIDLHRVLFAVAGSMAYLGQVDAIPAWVRYTMAALSPIIAALSNRDALPVVGKMFVKAEAKAEAAQ